MLITSVMYNSVVDIVVLMKIRAPQCCPQTVSIIRRECKLCHKLLVVIKKNSNMLIVIRWDCGT